MLVVCHSLSICSLRRAFTFLECEGDRERGREGGREGEEGEVGGDKEERGEQGRGGSIGGLTPQDSLTGDSVRH